MDGERVRALIAMANKQEPYNLTDVNQLTLLADGLWRLLSERREQQAIIAARKKIVEGAVGMVHMALDQLAAKGVVKLDDERRAAMVSNLLVVLCGDRGTQPVVNTGTLYG